MYIPEAQLETWSHSGADVGSQTIFNSVKSALSGGTSTIRNMSPEIYLQGSYHNDTHVRADSDVDIVVQYNGTFGHNAETLPASQFQSFKVAFPNPATYFWANFRSDVLDSLRAYYGADAVKERDRCLKVSFGPGRLTADVVPAILYRHYNLFGTFQTEPAATGIWFQDRDNRIIRNFPKLHYENGVQKNSLYETNGWFKPSVRMFKNARTRAVDLGLMPDNIASSYFVDCLIWNVPNDKFGGSYRETYFNVVKFLAQANLNSFSCRNKVIPLFGTAPEQWTVESANQLISGLVQLWDTW